MTDEEYQKALQRKCDENTVDLWLKIAGPLASVIPGPPWLTAAVERLKADEEQKARHEQFKIP